LVERFEKASTPTSPGSAGPDAAQPGSPPARHLIDLLWRLYASSQNNRILLVAAGVTFYGLLALFPATAAVVSLYGLFADAERINEHLRLMSGFLPDGALTVIGEEIKRIAAQRQATLGMAFLGTLALSVWGANAGTKAIFDALNLIYREPEKRGFLVLTWQSLLFTSAGVAFALLALGGIVVVPLALQFIGVPERSGGALLTLLRWPLLYLVILLALACLYRYGPSRTEPRVAWISWGSASAGAIWIAASWLLSWYVANFASYNATYGSLGAVIGFMIWMWLSTIIVLLGAEINAELEHRSASHTHEP
jgi:membrane protein